MPTFSNQLPPKTERKGYDLHRTPPDKPIKGLITCDDLIGCYTHWWGGRTVPCEGETCEACKNNSPSRWHCYLSVLESGTHDHFLFECTGKAALPLIAWREEHGTLRGVLMTAFRPKRKRNARVEMILKAYDCRNTRLPQPPDLIRALSVIWQLPGAACKIEGAVNQTARIVTDPDILDAQRFCPADGNGSHKGRKRESVC